MKKSKKGFFILIVVAIVCILASLFIVVVLGGKKGPEKEKVGLIIPANATDKGYMSEHYQGALKACDNLGLELVCMENVADTSNGECPQAVAEMVKQGIKVIILCSYGYQVEMMDLMDQYPDISFYCCSDAENGENFIFYFSRMYQARYLSGVLAGMSTKTNKIGYIAAMENCEVVRGINAFTLGVKAVNPQAEVIVYYTGSWNDAEIEKAHTKELIEKEGIDLVTYHQNEANVLDTAEEYGIYSIGYNMPTDGYSDHVLASVRSDWSIIYEDILQDNFQNGKASRSLFWIGLEKDAVFLSNMSDLVTPEIQTRINEETQRIKNGVDVFSGNIIDNEGNRRCNEGEILSDKSLVEEMNWYVDGVVLYE